MEAHGAGLRRFFVLAFCVAGIWSAYIYQGLLQETLSTKRFGSDGKRFEHLAFLNLVQNVVCLVWSYIMIKLWSRSSSGGAPWWTYWSAGITNTICSAMGIKALKYISYPAQVLAKSSKIILVIPLVASKQLPDQSYPCVVAAKIKFILVALSFHAYQQVSYMILQRVAPVTHAVGNCVKRVVVIMSSVIFFKTHVSMINALGTVIALVGVFLYSRVKGIKAKPKTA